MPPERREERYQPLALLSVTLIALLGFSVFFLSFLVAPLAILAIFYVGFAASDRAKRTQGNGDNVQGTRLAAEARARQGTMERSDALATLQGETLRPRP
ncbi:MAG TPA: hypothetical protein VGN69_09795 [Solirubrobacteraceae bacterium]|jgi:type IV secretory pathway TrbL component|nr:hypothetical protein [Solirubrobacteraceae bacterium]